MRKILILTISLCLVACTNSSTPTVGTESEPVVTEASAPKISAEKLTSVAYQTETSPSLESTADPVLVTKFFDFQCPHCRVGHATLVELKSLFGSQILIKYRHFPNYQGSYQIAHAAECARTENKFEAFMTLYFENYFSEYSGAALTEIATELALDVDRFTACMNADVHRSVIEQDMQLARQLQIRGGADFYYWRPKVGWNTAGIFVEKIDKSGISS